MDTQKKVKPTYTYQAVYRYLVDWIEAAPSTAEQRLPSLRALAQRLNVSVSSTKYAYSLLEDEGRVYARPKLGYFIRGAKPPLQKAPSPNLLDAVFSSARQPGMLALSSDAPAMLLSLEKPLLMIERELTRQYPRSHAPLYQPFGGQELRSVLAARYTRSAHDHWQSEHAFIGSDLHSILALALRALNLEGKVALVESPCSWAVLRQLKSARMKVIELPLQENGRFDLSQFHRLLRSEPVHLAVLSSAISVPHGSAMPADDKRQICRWLAEHDVWLFENDSYGEFSFDVTVARYREFADPNRLLVFSTFDKIIGSEAPYGYLLCRPYADQLQRLFLERAFRLSPIRQKAIAKLYTSGRVDQHLQRLCVTLRERIEHMKTLLHRHGQDCLRIVDPKGGATLWLEATRPVDMRRVFERLLEQRIVIAPGEIFSQQGLWQSHLRLSCTVDWSKDISQALQCLIKAIQAEAYTP